MSDPEKPDVPIPPPPPVPPGGQPQASAGAPSGDSTAGGAAQPAAGQEPAAGSTTPPQLQGQWTYDKSELPQRSSTFNTMAIVLVLFCFMGLIWVLGSSKGLIKGGGLGTENTAKVASEMVEIREPLPVDWQWGLNTDVLGVKIAELEYKPAGQTKAAVEFISMPNRQKLTADKMVDQPDYLNRGLTTEGANFSSEARGETSIAGHKMFYAHGTRAIKGTSAVEIGFVQLGGDKVLQIQSTEYGSTNFDPALVKPIWDSVVTIKE